MNVAVITERQYDETRRRFRGAYTYEWGGEPEVEFITADQLVDVLKSATGAVFQLSTRFPLWDSNERARLYVLRDEINDAASRVRRQDPGGVEVL